MRQALEASGTGYWEWDFEDRSMVATPFHHLLFGFPSGEGSAIPDGRQYRDRFHPDDRARLVSHFRRGLEEGASYEDTFRICLPDGTERWIHSTGVITCDAADRPRWMVGTSRDVTREREAVAALQVSEERLRLASDAIVGGIFDWDLVTNRVDRTEGLLRLLGLAPGDIDHSRRAWLARIHPQDASVANETFEEAVRHGRDAYESEYRIQHQDGHWVTVWNRSSILRDATGKPVRTVGITLDVTERRRIERAHRKSEERLRLAAEVAGVGTFDNDYIAGTFTWSHELREIYGFTDDEPITPEKIAERYHPDDRERTIRERDASKNPAGDGLLNTKLRILRPDGTIRWIALRAQNWFAGESPPRRPVRMIGAVVDITAEREAQEALREADRRKDDFLAMLGHELRNPLTVIYSALDLLRIGTPSKRDWAEDIIRQQSVRLTRIVDDLLEVSRVSRGKIVLRLAPVMLGPLLTRAIENVRPQARERALQLTLGLPVEPLWLNADAIRLDQVFSNLFTNAIRYSNANGRIAARVLRDGNECLIEINDSGVGIAPELIDRIFEPFTQAPTSLDRPQGGLGLGLSLVRSLVQLHGGTVGARSQGLGLGSTFDVRLPLTEAPAPAPAAPLPLPSDEPSRHILLVDDNEPYARVLAQLLERRGHRVSLAFDGTHALELVLPCPPEIALLDLGLPGLDGYQLGHRLRERHGPKLLLIAVSGYVQPADRERSRAAGFNHHLAKPLEFPRLVKLLGQMEDHPR